MAEIGVEIRVNGRLRRATVEPRLTLVPATGFWLNGINLKIKGVCLHQEAGALGMAVPRSIWERRLAKLKEFGVHIEV